MENQINKSTLNDKIAEFVSSSRNIFIGLLAVVAAVVIVYGAIVIVSLNGTVKALADIDSISGIPSLNCLLLSKLSCIFCE